MEEQSHLNSLHDVVLQLILEMLLTKPIMIDASALMWQPAVRLMSAGSSPFREALRESLCESFPALQVSESRLRKSWATSLLAALRGGNRGCWQRMSAMRAIRSRTQCSTPLLSSPKLSGASLCAVGSTCLVLFGGRCSISGETLGATYVVRVLTPCSGIAQWERLICKEQPPARCYHSAVRGSTESTMFVFGGASNGGILLGDAWRFEVTMVPAGPQGCMSSYGQWCQCKNAGSLATPSARSSHVCAPWSHDGSAILHGGLGEGGTKSGDRISKSRLQLVKICIYNV